MLGVLLLYSTIQVLSTTYCSTPVLSTTRVVVASFCMYFTVRITSYKLLYKLNYLLSALVLDANQPNRRAIHSACGQYSRITRITSPTKFLHSRVPVPVLASTPNAVIRSSMVVATALFLRYTVLISNYSCILQYSYLINDVPHEDTW
jgi:hypothetical protein